MACDDSKSRPLAYRGAMARPKPSSRYTPKKEKARHGQLRRRQHGDHFHTERWCEHHQQWEPAD